MKWLWIYEMYGEQYPTYVKNTKIDEKPDPQIWINDKNARHMAYVDTGDYIYFGYFTSKNCFIANNYQDINKTWDQFKNRKQFSFEQIFTQEDIKTIEATKWSYLDNREFEKFTEDEEKIENGYLIQTLFYSNNSIKSKTIIDLDTGELVYHYHWGISKYWNEDLQKELYFISSHERFDNGKYMKTVKKFSDKYKKNKWTIELPLSYKGIILDELYGQLKKANRRIKRL